jgi:hypothetical protein
MVQVTLHGKNRMIERCKIKPKSVERLAQIAFDKGLTMSDVSGSLYGYIASLCGYNGHADNIRLYGDKIYIFCGNVLVTIYDTPKIYLPIVNKLMHRKREKDVI